MGVTRTPKGLDSAKTKAEVLQEQIRDLKIEIAHGKTYNTNKDYGMLELKLQQLLRQQSGESK